MGLAKKEFDIVELLSQNPGQVFDKERIYEHIWGYDSEGDSSVVAEHIRRIRSKIAAYTDRMYMKRFGGVDTNGSSKLPQALFISPKKPCSLCNCLCCTRSLSIRNNFFQSVMVLPRVSVHLILRPAKNII